MQMAVSCFPQCGIFFFKKNICLFYLCTWLHQVLAVACRLLDALVPWPGPLHWECGILAPGPLGKSWGIFLNAVPFVIKRMGSASLLCLFLATWRGRWDLP